MLEEHNGVGGTSAARTRTSVCNTPGAAFSFWSHFVSRTSSKLMFTPTALDKWLSDGRTRTEQNKTLKLSHNAGDKLRQEPKSYLEGFHPSIHPPIFSA